MSQCKKKKSYVKKRILEKRLHFLHAKSNFLFCSVDFVVRYTVSQICFPKCKAYKSNCYFYINQTFSNVQVQKERKETEERKVTGVLWGRRAMQDLDLRLVVVQKK